jgi:hypothetical protein
MTEIPIMVLVLVIAVISVLAVVAFIFRTKFPPSMLLFLCGGILLVLFLTTDDIRLDTQIQNITKSGDVHIINYEGDFFLLKSISGEPTFIGIMFIFMALMFIIVGGLVEFKK